MLCDSIRILGIEVMEFLYRDDLTKTGFAGVREHRLVMDPKAFGSDSDQGGWKGLGNLVYLADSRFLPKGETHLHDHHEVDVISVMVEGRITHEGSLEHGQMLDVNDVQVQRAGAEGFSHNEINPDDTTNRMIQLWVLPEERGQPASYKFYQPQNNKVTRVYGGSPDQHQTFASRTLVEVALLDRGQSMDIEVPFLAYLSRGSGFANEDSISEGTLMRGEQMTYDAAEDTQLIIVHLGN
ncbi:pirin family protein [Thiogranum longum]